jgi:hypothetical protein
MYKLICLIGLLAVLAMAGPLSAQIAPAAEAEASPNGQLTGEEWPPECVELQRALGSYVCTFQCRAGDTIAVQARLNAYESPRVVISAFCDDAEMARCSRQAPRIGRAECRAESEEVVEKTGVGQCLVTLGARIGGTPIGAYLCSSVPPGCAVTLSEGTEVYPIYRCDEEE